MSYLELHKLRVTIGERVLVASLDLQLERGQVLALLGSNGVGKTTLLRTLCGLTPYGGSILMDQVELRALTRDQRLQRVAFVPERHQLGAGFNAESFCAMTAKSTRAKNRAMGLCGVEFLKARPLAHLSDGELRRVAVARAIATPAQIIVMDEPFNHLDPRACQWLAELIREETKTFGRIFVIAGHQLDAMHQCSDFALGLLQPQKYWLRPTAELVSDPHWLHELYHPVPVGLTTD